jgi:hypothetical protein
MFPVYAVGICLGFDIRFVEFLAFITESDLDQLHPALLLSVIPFVMTLMLSLFAIRMIVSGHRRTAGVVMYLACCFLCLLIGTVIVPLLVFQ